VNSACTTEQSQKREPGENWYRTRKEEAKERLSPNESCVRKRKKTGTPRLHNKVCRQARKNSGVHSRRGGGIKRRVSQTTHRGLLKRTGCGGSHTEQEQLKPSSHGRPEKEGEKGTHGQLEKNRVNPSQSHLMSPEKRGGK